METKLQTFFKKYSKHISENCHGQKCVFGLKKWVKTGTWGYANEYLNKKEVMQNSEKWKQQPQYLFLPH